MPVARFQMPDGRIARFEVPEGTTPEQAQQQIAQIVQAQGAALGAQQQPVAEPDIPGATDLPGADQAIPGASKFGKEIAADPEKIEQIDKGLASLGLATLNEFASVLNRGVAQGVDFLGSDTINALLNVGGFEARVPTLESGFEAIGAAKPPGTFLTEDTLLRDITTKVAEFLPAAANIGALTRNVAGKLPALVEGGESIGRGLLRQVGAGKARQDVSGALLSGAGAALGEEVAGAPGEQVGAVLGPLATLPIVAGKQAIATLARAVKAAPAAEAQQIIEAGRREGVRVLTTDVAPPQTFIGRATQSLSEKLGPLGSGPARAKQQVARQNVVENLADNFGVELDTPFARNIVESLSATRAKALAGAQGKVNGAVDVFNQFGRVPVPTLQKTVRQRLQQQAKLGPKADAATVRNLEDTLVASQGADDFQVLKEIRSDLIEDIAQILRSENQRGLPTIQGMKSAIDKDMARFANKAVADESGRIDRVASAARRNAGKEWRQGNRDLAKEIDLAKETELGRIFRTGDATPENVLQILNSGKRSQLVRLRNNTGPKGRAAAQGAIIQDALKRSGFDAGDINPDKFVNALKRPQTQQAIDVFFDETGKKQLIGIQRLLDATRQAQRAPVVTPTGIQAFAPSLLVGAGAAGSQAPLLTIATATTLKAVTSAYESQAFRTSLLKLATAKKGSKAERVILEQMIPAILAGLGETTINQNTAQAQ